MAEVGHKRGSGGAGCNVCNPNAWRQRQEDQEAGVGCMTPYLKETNQNSEAEQLLRRVGGGAPLAGCL